ncbi:MAG: phosphate regulon transcriptional regulatory protein PhoB [Alphaproteobacteria bacterium CG11_big_fil_rev_8_21_14_0_20_44_7]|nr:MAG: phosphate regulon transcriptional regulatory protein PhoB [Alphaproteobacteria bacterium CG11_big_fil_rev_8_21_14_0_20_44_7]
MKAEGFTVEHTDDGEESLQMVKENTPDIILLDWMLPSISGIEVCRRLRQSEKTRNIPIIMVTARGEEADKLLGLDYGADDYITKPFSPAELIARMRAVLRRIRPAFSQESLKFASVIMDLSTHKVTRQEKEVAMGPTEFKLLRHFMENPKRVFSREQLLDSIWGNDIYVELRTVDVHIRRLRKALEVEPNLPDLIRTVRSAGYALEEPES